MLRARRLVERGVRFVHVHLRHAGRAAFSPGTLTRRSRKNHSRHVRRPVDKPIAALLRDLKARGLLDSTLVVWTSEFGRTPYGQTGDGRDHNPWGYTSWIAGGGIKPARMAPRTKSACARRKASSTPTTCRRRCCNQLGLDFSKLTFQHQGRTEKATTVFGDVIKPILA